MSGLKVGRFQIGSNEEAHTLFHLGDDVQSSSLKIYIYYNSTQQHTPQLTQKSQFIPKNVQVANKQTHTETFTRTVLKKVQTYQLHIYQNNHDLTHPICTTFKYHQNK